ncbi:uncharacterized protein UBRO_20944 [Ustilago bromivora]|uniref:Uncharacterized protein n=1 Tax=Ustilago bromivora TaxID=307758 RepID=A0A1K0GD17_9BASI|nr:uncharacterized protein UBRO_20944 [Ustilago bromivora]
MATVKDASLNKKSTISHSQSTSLTRWRGTRVTALPNHTISLSNVQHSTKIGVTACTLLSWDRMNAQEELESYEETMRSDCGSGKERVLTELSEIDRIEGSMTELVGISRSKVLLQSLSGSVVPHPYDRSHGNWFKDASISNPTRGGQWTRKGPPPEEVGALHNDEISVRRWVPTSGGR